MNINIRLTLIGLLTIVSLHASETIFDLNAQDFSLTKADEHKNALYKINEQVMFETNMKKTKKGDFYFVPNNFIRTTANIFLNKPLQNWQYAFKIRFEDHYTSSRARMITFRDTNENILVCKISENGFKIMDQEFEAALDKERFTLQLTKKANIVTASIDGQKIYETEVNFGNLKTVSSQISGSDRLYKLSLVAQ